MAEDCALTGWGHTPECWEPLAELGMPVNGVAPPDLADPRPPEGAIARAAGHLPEELGILMGWSLGGLVALEARQRCEGLVLIATPPSFLARPRYPAGMAEATFAEFRAGVASDPRAALRRFYALQFQGDAAPRGHWGGWRDRILDWNRSADALLGWLDALAGTDLTERPPALQGPTLIVHGEADPVVDAVATEFFAERGPDVQVRRIPGAGHAPHISHPEEVAEAIGRFVRYIAGW